MAIENAILPSRLVENFAVCCTANLTVRHINHFLDQVHQHDFGERVLPTLTLVHNLHTHLFGATRKLVEIDGDDDALLQSPFTNCGYARIRQLLQQLKHDTDSKIATDWFLVLDERSDKDSTAMIVNVEDEDGELITRSLRVEYAVSSRYLAAASIGHAPLDELIEIVREAGEDVLHDR